VTAITHGGLAPRLTAGRPVGHNPPMSERFTDELAQLVASIWEAQHAHPFVRGIGDGTLEVERFAHWVRQDYLFLIEYCRLFGLAAARAPDLDTISRFADLLQVTARTEMDLHRGYAAQFGISAADLERESMAPTTRGYTDFLLRVAATGDFAELASALLPCMWGFSEIGQRLAVQPRPSDARYAAWIEMYADPEFADLATWCRSLVDRLAEDAGPAARERMAAAFVTSSRYELAFWEASYTLERWPDQSPALRPTWSSEGNPDQAAP
jgi:thiaminase/transcriptional activator TenA